MPDDRIDCCFAQAGHMGHTIDKNIIFPDFVVGGGVSTQIILMNPQPGLDLTGTLFFFNQDGTPLQVVNNGQTVNQVSVSLPAHGIDFVTVTGVNQTLDADGRLGVSRCQVRAGPG